MKHAYTEIPAGQIYYESEGSGEPVEFTETHYERAYDENEVRQMLSAAGFQSVTVYNAYTFTPPTPTSDRMYWVACK